MIYLVRGYFKDFGIDKEIEAKNEYHASLEFFEEVYDLVSTCARNDFKDWLTIEAVAEMEKTK
ncbi:Uncharacterised protein [Streptococcus pseudoporcinus]|uniref:Uncharacterized protein n=1 Tax=Streptococcus pseudoporcinus TaxID=361101 RepID=A0A4U9Y1Y7_9STRE|nr:hypothetical protein [Streptococcus pseudoporcinus]QBX18710.1 hypothetical protein Javan443_0036 [Streptococcus phage Javan443]QBX18771.1 hypothetical protein Javan445_0031 [Streptococcus phage Javan445]VTS19802.1 Uncharacterised protein [Streptococcus pseudoporcinus]VUC69664.1 Uncharacterised protein [Streptococcus pseudoporcinus]VUC99976.1 Uncharacterised protein [Streptococcus pseudoporcinus]